MKTKLIHVCYGVQPHFTCHFNGACYGEICINPDLCSKKTEELTKKEKRYIKEFNKRT